MTCHAFRDLDTEQHVHASVPVGFQIFFVERVLNPGGFCGLVL
jgi:hypothetical protein